MSATAVLAIAATTGGVVLGFAPVAQMRLVIARKSSEGISIAYWLILIGAMSLWLAYGIAARDAAIITANTVTIAVALAMVGVLVRYRGRPAAAPVDDGEGW